MRAEMLELAIGGQPEFSVCRFEIERGGVNYTVDTLGHFHKEHATAELYFLMGTDALRDLPNWKDPVTICDLAVPVVVDRAGAETTARASDSLDLKGLAGLVSQERMDVIRAHHVIMPRIDISGTELRSRVAAGKSIRYRTPRAVEKYIGTHRLYRAGG
jgi:nicotinate-nucleotide adenylyltransferase